MVTASVQIAYNLGDIQQQINSVSTKIDNLEDMEDMSDDAKDIMRKDYEEILEALNIMKEKLS